MEGVRFYFNLVCNKCGKKDYSRGYYPRVWCRLYTIGFRCGGELEIERQRPIMNGRIVENAK